LDKFLQRHKLPNLTKKETYINNSLVIKEIEFILKNFPTKKTVGSLVNSIQHGSKKKNTNGIQTIRQWMRRELSDSFCEDRIK
jgi:hypothetical protein